MLQNRLRDIKKNSSVLIVIIAKIKSYVVGLGLAAILVWIILYLLNGITYLDPINFCLINLDEDISVGDKRTMHQAVDLVGKRYSSNYKTVCKYVNTISEQYCPIHQANGGDTTYAKSTGCFIKGTKTVFISPSYKTSEDIITMRAYDIIKYANFSKDYWESKK